MGENLFLGTFCAVFGAGLASLGYACGIERTAHDVITNAGQILHTAASHENGAVLLKVVAFAGNVNNAFLLVGESYSRDLSHSGVRLLGSRRRYRKANAAFLRTIVENRALGLYGEFLSAVFNQLIDCRHKMKTSL